MEGIFNLLVLLLVLSSVLSKIDKKRTGGSLFETIRRAMEEQEKKAVPSVRRKASETPMPMHQNGGASLPAGKRRPKPAKPADAVLAEERRFESLENASLAAAEAEPFASGAQTPADEYSIGRDKLINAVIWSEILGKPKALRGKGAR